MSDRDKVVYEWDYETVNPDGDIEDHNHANKLTDFVANHVTDTLVLVRDIVDCQGAVVDRHWAYVTDGKLPEYFSDTRGAIGIAVPKRFRVEFHKHTKTLTL